MEASTPLLRTNVTMDALAAWWEQPPSSDLRDATSAMNESAVVQVYMPSRFVTLLTEADHSGILS